MTKKALEVLWITNRGNDAPDPGIHTTLAAERYRIDVRSADALTPALLERSAERIADGRYNAIVLDWAGELTTDAVRTLNDADPSLPLVALVDDELMADEAAADALLEAGLCDLHVRRELTTYWLMHALRCSQRLPTTASTRARRQMENEHSWLHSAVQQMPAGVLVQDAESGSLLFANEQSHAIWGTDALEEKSTEELKAFVGFHADGRPIAPQEWPLARAIAGGERIENETVEFIRGDGERRTMAVSAAPLRDSTDTIWAGVAVIQDVTESLRAQKALAENEERLSLALRAGRMAAWSWDCHTDAAYLSATQSAFDVAATVHSGAAGSAYVHPDDLPAYRALAQRTLEEGGTLHSEVRVIHPESGAIVWQEVHGVVDCDAAGTVVGLSGITQDITQRKRAELLLAESERNFRVVLRHAPIVVARVDRALRYLWVHNTQMGLMPDLFVGKHMGDVQPIAEMERIIACVEGVFATGLPATLEFCADLPDGRHTYDLHVEPDMEEDGRFDSVTTLAIDNSRRQALIEALALGNERYRRLIEATTAAVWSIDPRTGTVSEPSPEWESYTGQQWPAYAGAGALDAVHPDDRTATTVARDAARQESRPYHTQLRLWHTPTGLYRHVEERGVPLFDEAGHVREWMVAFIDVEERVSAVRRAEDRAQEIETLMEMLPVGVFIALDPRAETIVGNRMAYSMLRMEPNRNISSSAPEETRPTHFRVCIDGREPTPDELPAQRAAMHGVDVVGAEVELHFEDGTVKTLLGNARPLFGPGGKTRGSLTVFLDITERKQLQHALAESRERLRLALESGGMGFWIWDGGPTALWSRATCSFYGIEPTGDETVVNLDAAWERMVADDVHPRSTRFEDFVNERGEYSREFRIPQADGSVRWYRSVGQMVNGEGGTPPRLMGVMYETTVVKQVELELKRSQEDLERRVEQRTQQLERAYKQLQRQGEQRRQTEEQMDEIRRLIAHSQESERMRLAHELHDGPMQELAAIAVELNLLARKLEEERRAPVLLLGDRVKVVNRVLRSLASDLRPPILDSFGLAAAMQSHIEQIEGRTPAIRFVLELDEVDALVEHDAHLQLYRVFQQAVQNAQVHAGASVIRTQLRLDGDVVRLEVSDDGKGFSLPKHWVDLARAGHLGIVGMSERMAAVGGRLDVTSEPGAGTVIAAVVPVSATPHPGGRDNG